MIFLLKYWKLLAFAGIIAGAAFYHFDAVSDAHDKGYAQAQALCDAENLKAKLATMEQLVAARDRVIIADKAEGKRREIELAGLQERTNAYVADIERLDAEGNACRADAERARRLLDIWRGQGPR